MREGVLNTVNNSGQTATLVSTSRQRAAAVRPAAPASTRRRPPRQSPVRPRWRAAPSTRQRRCFGRASSTVNLINGTLQGWRPSRCLTRLCSTTARSPVIIKTSSSPATALNAEHGPRARDQHLDAAQLRRATQRNLGGGGSLTVGNTGSLTVFSTGTLVLSGAGRSPARVCRRPDVLQPQRRRRRLAKQPVRHVANGPTVVVGSNSALGAARSLWARLILSDASPYTFINSLVFNGPVIFGGSGFNGGTAANGNLTSAATALTGLTLVQTSPRRWKAT